MNTNYISQLRQLLELRNWTQAKLAERLDVSSAALNRWLEGHAGPRAQRISAIDRLYKELVGFPAVDRAEVQLQVREANRLKCSGLWKKIAATSTLQDDLLLEDGPFIQFLVK